MIWAISVISQGGKWALQWDESTGPCGIGVCGLKPCVPRKALSISMVKNRVS